MACRLLANCLLLGGFVAGTAVLCADEPEKDPDGIEFFEKRIQPLLVDHCYKCHSDKAEKLEGNLRVDSREGLLKGGSQGPAIEPGEPENSLLIKAVNYDMDDLKMPPRGRLEDEQIADLQKWVKIGAPYAKKPGKKSEGIPWSATTHRRIPFLNSGSAFLTNPFAPVQRPSGHQPR